MGPMYPITLKKIGYENLARVQKMELSEIILLQDRVIHVVLWLLSVYDNNQPKIWQIVLKAGNMTFCPVLKKFWN